MNSHWTKTAAAVSVGAMALLGHRSFVMAHPLMCSNCVAEVIAPDLLPFQVQPPQGEIWYQTQQTWAQLPVAAKAANAPQVGKAKNSPNAAPSSNAKARRPPGDPANPGAPSAGLINYCVYANIHVGVSSTNAVWRMPFTLSLLGAAPALPPVNVTGPFKPDRTTQLTSPPVWCVIAPANQPPQLTLMTSFPNTGIPERTAPVVFGPTPPPPPPGPANPTN